MSDPLARPPQRRVRIVTLGCKVNQAESEAIAATLADEGATSDTEGAPAVVVLNTCTVTGEADAKSRKAIRRALALPGEPVVVVTGCLASIDPGGVAGLGTRVVVEPDKAHVAALVAEVLAEAGATRAESVRATPSRARVQVKVQDGCDAYCAYCIVPYARGVPRSVPAARVAREVAALAEAGVGEVVLTGINIGRYADGDARLAELIARVAESGIARIRISSIEPDDVTDELLGVLAATPAVVRHLHIPLQSGADATLAAMGRRYDTRAYATVLARARAALPGVAITTDVLVGFPGESDDDFERTLAFVRDAAFARLHVFRYSARPGTPAAARSDQVPSGVRSARSEAARALGDELASAWARGRAGEHADVLVERVEEGRAEGTSEDYLRVAFDVHGRADVRVGDIVTVIVGERSGAVVAGRMVSPG